jgi:methyltransferase
MELNVTAYLGLLLIVALLRIYELQISRRHQREMLEHGATKVNDPRFRWMVLVHVGVLAGSAAEVVFLHRPFYRVLGSICFALFVGANTVRWWVIRTLGEHWNVQVMNSTGMGIITTGPFRYVRHPNYAAVFVEMLVLPLMHCAWLTAA